MFWHHWHFVVYIIICELLCKSQSVSRQSPINKKYRKEWTRWQIKKTSRQIIFPWVHLLAGSGLYYLFLPVNQCSALTTTEKSYQTKYSSYILRNCQLIAKIVLSIVTSHRITTFSQSVNHSNCNMYDLLEKFKIGFFGWL